MNITRYFRAMPSGPPRVEKFDRHEFVAGQAVQRGGQRFPGLHEDEILAGVETGRAQQQRKSQMLGAKDLSRADA